MQLDAAAVAAGQLTSVWDHSAWDLVESGTLGTLGTSLGHHRNHPAMTGGKGGTGEGRKGKGVKEIARLKIGAVSHGRIE